MHSHEYTQAKHIINTLLNARESVLYTHSETPNHFAPMLAFLTNTYSRDKNISIYTGTTKPTNAMVLAINKLSVDAQFFSHMTDTLAEQHRLLFSTSLNVNHAKLWINFSATPHPTDPLIFNLLLIGFPLLVFIIVWGCFLEGIREVSAFGQAFVKGIFQHATVMHPIFGFLMQI